MAEQTLDTRPGQAVYNRATLAAYDAVVLGLSNHAIWKCPTRRIQALYDRHVSERHLDVGVGTGWYIGHLKTPPEALRLTLLDLNDKSLQAASRRLSRYQPRCVKADVLAPIDLGPERFASVSMTYLLHCLPGDLPAKSRCFDAVIPYLEPGGTLFGATLLSQGIERSAAARALMGFYNRKGIFSNEADSLVDLDRELRQRFSDVAIEVVGCAALFSARL
ncbi:class I SAM-dependent methyltransferase [Fulvimarina sp. MAC8]|uniref:class I SAM-dependent methyltransferase n=1 Tax=Fulvimarina sp. MAC8 TaxID=3162874 RepID=UPI0032F0473A